MKIFLVALVCCLFIACQQELPAHINSFMSSAKAYNNKPNIILILIDDMGYEVPTVNGGQSYLTPNLDSIAANNLRFTNCFSTPLCSPSRTELLTGKYNFRNYTAWGSLSRDNKTIANSLKEVGYTTGVFGKWQFGGGDSSIKQFGFDSYIVHEAMEGERGNKYKNPLLYTHGAYIADSLTNGKYGDDIVKDSLFNFMQTSTPFFAYYPLLLCHKPWQPTPDDSEFVSFGAGTRSDIKFFPSMVKYADKIIGEVVRKADSIGNTIVIITSDNGTQKGIYSNYNGQLVQGGKGQPNVMGTHVPLIVKWAGKTYPRIDSSLIDFSDFFKTIADIADAPNHSYGVLDGVSFLPNILGLPNANRTWSFCDFNPKGDDEDTSTETIRHSRFAQTKTYKKYDTIASPDNRKGRLFNMITDPTEPGYKYIRKPTPDEIKTDSCLQSVITQMN